MYVPEHFRLNNQDTLVTLIQDYGFGLLVSDMDGMPFASHIPFLVDVGSDRVMLRAHVAKANPHWKELEEKQVLAIFQGPHSYISPSWYRGPGVPTWNYAAVHAYGNARLVQDTEVLHQIVLELSEQYEKRFKESWIPDYDESMLNAIVGIEIEVDRIEGKFKLSQNRSAEDRDGVIEALSGSASENDQGICRLMRLNYD